MNHGSWIRMPTSSLLFSSSSEVTCSSVSKDDIELISRIQRRPYAKVTQSYFLYISPLQIEQLPRCAIYYYYFSLTAYISRSAGERPVFFSTDVPTRLDYKACTSLSDDVNNTKFKFWFPSPSQQRWSRPPDTPVKSTHLSSEATQACPLLEIRS